MKLNDLTKLINEGINYLNFYDSVYFASENNLLSSVSDQKLLIRLNNSIVSAMLTLDDDTTIFNNIRSASYFLKDAESMLSQSQETVLSWKDMSLEEVRAAILDAIISFEQYVVFAGFTSLLGVDEQSNIQAVSVDFLRAKFPNNTEEEIQTAAEIYVDYVEELEEMELAEEVMNIDYAKTGRGMLEYEEDEDIEIDVSDVSDEELGLKWD